MSKQHTFSAIALFSFAEVASLATACSSTDDDSIRPNIAVINRASSALSAESITAINGTYGAACDGRDPAGTDTWTYVVDDANASTLSVRKNDADCALTITSVVAGDTYIATPAITLETSWQATSSSFAADGGPLAFYGNAMISDTSWSAAPTISVLVSDSPSASDAGEKQANFASESASVSSQTVPASTYTISFASFDLEQDVNHVVQSVSGYAQLTAGEITGQDYAIFEGSLTGESSLSEIAAAWDGSTSKGLLSELDSLQLPATLFGLHSPAVDLDDSPKRTVIIRNTDSGVSSYQLLLVTFVH